jgi:ATP-dependent Clp endopeptidase proteolytic subunit ClpP
MNKLNSRRRSTKGADVVVEEQLAQEEQTPMMLDMPGMRMVALYGDLDEKKGNDIISDLFSLVEMKNILEKQLKTMDAKTKKQVLPQLSHKDPVKFVISTFGGNAVDMFGIYDAVKMVESEGIEVHTVGSGKVMSAGVLLLACGTKGQRRIGKNCRVMVHPVVGGAHGPSHDIQNEVEEIMKTQTQYIECLANETKLTVSRLNKLFSEKRNIYLSAEEAIKFGIADKIV